MGCNIHLHVEVRYNGKWEHYAKPYVERWYDLFDIMAGVRGDVTPIIAPKGLPSDISVITQLDYNCRRGDTHHCSWFNEEEIDRLQEWLNKEREKADKTIDSYHWDNYVLVIGVLSNTYLFGNSLTAFKHYDDSPLPEGCDAVRLVFWFDN